MADTKQLKTQTMLTTKDNPYDPFTQFKDWYEFDTQMGYCSCAYLARTLEDTSYEKLDGDELDSFLTEAIDRLVKTDPTGQFKVAEPKR